jgi:integrase/recombinase XerD
MSAMSTALDDYLALRHSLGYKLQRAGALLVDFVAYLERAKTDHVTVEAAVSWAMLAANPDSCWRAQRLGVVRCFARYLHSLDPQHQVPPPGLLHRGERRPEPFLYSAADILALMAAARRLRSPLRAATIETLIGLLAATGLRAGEAIRLDRGDLDVEQEVLIIRNSKLGKSRHVPLHTSTTKALRAYQLRRDELATRPSSPALFISTTGTRLRSSNLRTVFGELLEQAGLLAHRGRRGPRLGDLRHSFAVQTLLDWHLSDVDVGPRLPVLSTYLGHVSPASTYWYLSASPPLLAAAARRLDDAGQVLP